MAWIWQPREIRGQSKPSHMGKLFNSHSLSLDFRVRFCESGKTENMAQKVLKKPKSVHGFRRLDGFSRIFLKNSVKIRFIRAIRVPKGLTQVEL
jgi:hypothetical protein